MATTVQEKMQMLSDPKLVAKEISGWMSDYAKATGKKSLVIGVSGGVDSAVCYRLSMMTGLAVHPIFLPRDLIQAEVLMPLVQELLIPDDISPVTNEIEVLSWSKPLQPFPEEDQGGGLRALGNFHARIRMAALYYYSELFDGLVVGTTNMSEWYIGYFTKWGDGGVDIEPIQGLLKSEVYQLGAEGFDNPVPKSILSTPPSAGLWSGQTDEGEMGFTYDQLEDHIMGRGDDLPLDVAERIISLHESTNHKRDPVPPPR